MNRRLLLLISLVLLLAVGRGYGQILMGSAATYTQIGEEALYFYDSGGVPGTLGPNAHPLGYFATDISDTMSLRTNVSNSQLHIFFESFSMGYGDTLYIYDGSDCTADLIGAYNGVNTPGEITATGRWLTFVFHTDGTDDYAELSSGWVATVSALLLDPTICEMSNGATYMTCNAKFYDQGGPNGNIGVTSGTSWTEFTSPAGSHIQMHFTQFSVNGIMKIYDGQYYDANKRLIGQFCTSTSQPPLIISSGSTITIEYVAASGDANKPGWAADVTCLAELFESPEGSACPSIDITRNDTSVSWIEYDCANPVTILKAKVVATGPYTYDYTVQSIPYSSRIFDYSLGNSLGASVDDDWINMSGTALPFTFSFFGNNYTRVWPGANGLISMTVPSSSYCDYSYPVPPTSPPYNAVPYIFKNCIYGVYEDIYPGHYYGDGNIRVGVQGTAPCRAFVFNYDRVGLYGREYSQLQWCNTYQMVIYEGTNIIDVFVKYRKCCASTNSTNHEGIIGLQNNTSSQILIAPGRGMTGWEVLSDAQSEGWRFTPITPLDPNATITWYQNTIHPDSVIGTNFTQVVSPQNRSTYYIAVYHYTNAGGDSFDLKDTVYVHVDIPSVSASNNSGASTCPGDPVQLSSQVGTSTSNIQPVSFLWSCGDTLQNAIVHPQESGTYSVTVTFDNGCTNTDTTSLRVTEMDRPEISGIDHICFGESTVLTATHPTSNELSWNNGQSGNTITVSPTDTTEYVVTATLVGNCHTTDTFMVYVTPSPVPSFYATPTDIYVENDIGTVYCTNMSSPNCSLIWDFGDMYSPDNVVNDVQDPSHDYTHAGYYTITLTAVDSAGCRDSIKSRVSVTVPYFFYIPNAFSPNSDGVNERFAPSGEGVDPAEYIMIIYDRNGNILFKTHNPYDYWDGRGKTGKPCPAGVYVYYILLKTLNGETKEYNGSVTLLR
ncbi:MAG: gliding motility-associated C-terminal domain-containing protein [Bacteroidales bacterium]|nr:gliding motility-associated C-terminal domain-containing protein [Bacteroidales bacterium]